MKPNALGRILLLCFGLLTLLPAGAAVTPFENVDASQRQMAFQATVRNITVLRPAVAASQPAPLIVMLHYLGGVGDDMADLTAVSELVRDHGAWVILPEAYNGKWNYNMLGGEYSTVNDVAFLDSLISDALARYPVDPARVYMVGYSGGGMMTLRYACERPQRIAAAAVAGALLIRSLADKCDTRAPMPMALFQGEFDTVMEYGGDSIIMSAPETAYFWAAANGCAPQPLSTFLLNGIVDETLVHLDRWGACSNGEAVELYSVLGGGHTWPGTLDHSPGLGRTTQDVSATTALWSFFSRFSR
ncbi:MAG TPA: alpha/beta fold hydrolase [Solimonas sp.]|nr:alpha/beta fold hydrolase [Solimonas sp.]